MWFRFSVFLPAVEGLGFVGSVARLLGVGELPWSRCTARSAPCAVQGSAANLDHRSLPSPPPLRTGFQPRYLSERVLTAAKAYAALAVARGLTPTQLALAWAATRWCALGVSAPLLCSFCCRSMLLRFVWI